MKKNQQYTKHKRRTLQKIGQSKEQWLQVVRAQQLAIQTVLGAMQMAILASTPRPRDYTKGGTVPSNTAMVGERGKELVIEKDPYHIWVKDRCGYLNKKA